MGDKKSKLRKSLSLEVNSLIDKYINGELELAKNEVRHLMFKRKDSSIQELKQERYILNNELNDLYNEMQ